MKKTTFLKSGLLFWLVFLSANVFAQTPTFTAYSPTTVTQRTPITITGSGFTGVTQVRFNAIATTSFAVLNDNTISAVIPEITGTVAGGQSTLTVSVTKNNVTTATTGNTIAQLYYVAPVGTPSTAGVTRIITNYNGYWSSTGVTTNTANQPDASQSLMAFGYNGVLYSTGSESEITDVLGGSHTATTGTYTAGNFRALPINNIAGNAGPSNSGDPNLIVLASTIDGSSTAQVPTAPSVASLTVRDVLIDGIRGLDLGTGVTNLPSTSVLSFQASHILTDVADDEMPDIIVSQVASPSNNSFDVYCFVDSSGNIVGKPVQINLFNVPAVGTYKTDFFSLPTGTALSSATVNGAATPGGNTRDIRLVAYRLSDFGINETNRERAVQFKVMPSGTSDPAFMAYNRNSFNVPAPEITVQPVSVASCPGTSVSFTVGIATANTENVYRWEKDGVVLTDGGNITGSTTSTLQISNITLANSGAYRSIITNSAGATISTYAYLNDVIVSSTGSVTCQNETRGYVEVGAQGVNPRYQWYSNATNSTTGGTLITGANAPTYYPGNTAANTPVYYYAEVFPVGYECAKVTTPALEYKIKKAVAGTATGTQSICAGNNVQVTVQNSVGAIQWQQSTNGGTTWTNVTTGVGGTTETYNTDPLSTTTLYRATATVDNCTAAVSNIVTVSVNESNVWTGTAGASWSDSANWSCGNVPNIFTNAVVPSGANTQPVITNGTVSAKSITVQSGASLTIATTGSLKVINAVNVATGGTLTVENNGSLIQDSETANTGKITVKRNSNSLYRLDYTMWSSPVANQNLQAFSTGTFANRFYEYKYAFNPTTRTNVEQYFVTDASQNFALAKGYLIRMPNGTASQAYNEGNASVIFNGIFTGLANNGTITAPLSTQGDRYTAIGNPYPSPIGVVEFFNQNQNVLESGSAIYFWRKRNNAAVSSYATLTLAAFTANTGRSIPGNVTPDNYPSGGQEQAEFFGPGNNAEWRISQGQGFIVRTRAGLTGNPVATFKNTMRREAPASGTQAMFRTANTNTARLWLNLTGANDGFSQAAVAYMDNATLDIDYGYDGVQFTDSNNLSIYTIAQNNNLAIQARPAFTPSDVVPVGYVANAAGSYTIELDRTDGQFENNNQEIFIKDNATGVVTNIKDRAYTFTTQSGTFNERFEVVYIAEALGTDKPELSSNNVIVFKEGTSINISTGTVDMTAVTIYDVRGRILYSKAGINANQTTVSGLQAAQEVLIVEIDTVKGKVSKKIVY
jgi:hypothetical protein